MKKKLGLLALVLALVLGGNVAWADFYVVPVPGGVGTKITSLPNTITAPGFYYLASNLSVSGHHGITIESNHVTLDLMGFSLVGPGVDYDGIYMAGRTNVEIRNGTVRNFRNGIYSWSSYNIRVIQVRVDQNQSCGITLSGYNHLVKDCHATLNTMGIFVTSGTVSGNIASNNTNTGIRVGSVGIVVRNLAINNTDKGFILVDCVADQNTARGNGTNFEYSPSCVWGVNFGK